MHRLRKNRFWELALLLVAAVECPAQVTFTEYPVPTSSSYLNEGITKGPDGNLWFIEGNGIIISRMAPTGVVTGQFPVPSTGIYGNGSGAGSITAGPDGNLWFPEYFANNIGRITPGGVITEFPILSSGTFPASIAAGPDGNLWFTQYLGNSIGRITPAGVITEFPVPSGGLYGAFLITAGPDGNLWFTECRCSSGASGPMSIGRITPTGVITEFPVPTSGSAPYGITAGPDGNVWFTEATANKIGRITPAGVITEFPVPTSGASPAQITTGPDGNLWFTEYNGNNIGRITPAGSITEFAVPTASTLGGITAGPDGNLWFVETSAKNIGKITIAPLYSVCSLYDPNKATKSGSTIPIKLQLCDGTGNNLSSPNITLHAVSIIQTSTSISGQVQDAGNSNPDSDFRFDSSIGGTGGYIFNLKTTGLATGTYNLNFTVTGDTAVHTAPFQVK
jgi:streptogramin lyase